MEHFLLAFLGFSRLSRKLATFSGTLRRNPRVFSWLFQAFQETRQSRRSKECNVVNLLVAFPGLLGNPAIEEEPRVPCGKFYLIFSRKPQNTYILYWLVPTGLFRIKEKPGCARNHSSQKLRAFLHISKSPESMEIFFWFFQAFPGFPGNPGIKEEPGCASNHSSQKLRAFPYVQKSQESQEFDPAIPGNSWLLFAGVNTKKYNIMEWSYLFY